MAASRCVEIIFRARRLTRVDPRRYRKSKERQAEAVGRPGGAVLNVCVLPFGVPGLVGEVPGGRHRASPIHRRRACAASARRTRFFLVCYAASSRACREAAKAPYGYKIDLSWAVRRARNATASLFIVSCRRAWTFEVASDGEQHQPLLIRHIASLHYGRHGAGSK